MTKTTYTTTSTIVAEIETVLGSESESFDTIAIANAVSDWEDGHLVADLEREDFWRIVSLFTLDAEDEADGLLYEYSMDVLVNAMDDEIREELHSLLAPCDDLDFLAAYVTRHEETFGESFTI